MRLKNKETFEVDLFVDPRQLTKTEQTLLRAYINKDKLKNKTVVNKANSRSPQHA